MNWLNHLFITSAIACTALSPLRASSPTYSTFQEEKDSFLIWSQGNKHFTTSFYPHGKRNGDNFIFSPLSLQLGLAMTAELALNATQAEILEKAVLPENSSARHLGAEQMLNQLNTSMAGESVHLALANGAWLSSDIPFPSSFQTLLAQSYQAALHPANFRSSAEEVRKEINSWVEEKTLHQIQNLIADGSLSSETKLILVNTLYMRAPWKNPFNPENTYKDVFYGSEKSLSSIPYMQQRSLFGYLEEATYELIELPFQDSASTPAALSLFVVLPKEEYSLEEIEEKLTTRTLDHWITERQARYLDLSLPKFKISSSINAKEMLKKLGMQLPFSPEAEFDLHGQGDVAITDIVHNAVFEVDECGGTGSAGTGVIISPTSFPETTEVKVNRPFLIFVADKTSGIVLFAGRMVHPKS